MHASIAEDILKILLSHDFNHQSRGRVAHLIPDLLVSIADAVKSGERLPIYFLYGGGYRAAVGESSLAPVFAPDITELMLIYQIAKLEQKIRMVYPPGVSFSLVINNGVAAFVNAIPIAQTNDYVRRLRLLIKRLGADSAVWVLNQSELGDFAPDMVACEILPKGEIDPVDHAIVQRFLGRRCSVEEACWRFAAYEKAETVWGAKLRSIVGARSAVFCRQVAHPASLSFRPFPGGAIRVQNGTVGFSIGVSGPKPRLVTAVTWDGMQPIALPVRLELFHDISSPAPSTAVPIQVLT